MSVCEKSMVLVANIIKLSSLSLANYSFGATSSVRSLEPAHDRKMTRVDVVMQVPITEKNSKGESTVVDVDEKAEDFIRRIRNKIHKNQNDQQHVLG